MRVIINKNEELLDDGIVVADILKQKKLKKAAVWINGEQLNRKEYETYCPQEGDQIKILRLVGGG